MPAPMNTESRRKASATFHAKRIADGWRKRTFWLPPEVAVRLDEIKDVVGSHDEAVRQAILHFAGQAPAAAPPVDPAPVAADPPKPDRKKAAPKLKVQSKPKVKG